MYTYVTVSVNSQCLHALAINGIIIILMYGCMSFQLAALIKM